jgi:hypothetical protein
VDDIIAAVDSNIALMERPAAACSSFSLVPRRLYIQVCRLDLGNSFQERASRTVPEGSDRFICVRTCRALVQANRMLCTVACCRATSYQLLIDASFCPGLWVEENERVSIVRAEIWGV